MGCFRRMEAGELVVDLAVLVAWVNACPIEDYYIEAFGIVFLKLLVVGFADIGKLLSQKGDEVLRAGTVRITCVENSDVELLGCCARLTQSCQRRQSGDQR